MTYKIYGTAKKCWLEWPQTVTGKLTFPKNFGGKMPFITNWLFINLPGLDYILGHQ